MIQHHRESRQGRRRCLRAYLITGIQLFGMLLFFTSTSTVFHGCKENPVSAINNTYYVVDSLTNPQVQPRVIFTNPSEGAVGPFGDYGSVNNPVYPTVTIQFNKLVSIKVAAQTISLKSEGTVYPLTLADNFYTGSGYQINDPTLRSIFVYNVGSKYLANKVYTLSVDSSLIDIHGNRIAKTFSISYRPEPNFRVYYGYPTSTDVSPEYVYSTYIVFNSRVNAAILGKISIAPTVKGKWTLSPGMFSYGDSTSAYFSQSDTLLFDTKYTITVAGDATDAKGLSIGTPYQFSFATAPFTARVSGYSTTTGPGGIPVPSSIYVACNGSFDTSSVRSSVTITPSVALTVSLGYSYSGKYRDFYVVPNTAQYQSGTTYELKVKKTIRSLNGCYPKSDISFPFTTGS